MSSIGKGRARIERDETAICECRYIYIEGDTKTPFCDQYEANSLAGMNVYRKIPHCIEMDTESDPIVLKGRKRDRFFFRCSYSGTFRARGTDRSSAKG
jgi:hypothetical protein